MHESVKVPTFELLNDHARHKTNSVFKKALLILSILFIGRMKNISYCIFTIFVFIV